MEKHKTLPFAMYDLAVYLPGGALLLIFIQHYSKVLFNQTIGNGFLPPTNDYIGLSINAVAWLSSSYLAGHLGAFISSYLIERFVHTYIGYPSEIWLKRENRYNDGENPDLINLDSVSIRLKLPNRLIPWIILIAQAPALLWLALIKAFKPFGFYTPKIPFGLLPNVVARLDHLKIGVDLSISSRWEKIVEHFVANKCPEGYARMYNYLVIYGALRLLSLILLALSWAVLLNDFYLKITCSGIISFKETMFFLSLTAAYCISVMAFAKFNRRFFEESLLAFCLAPFSLFDGVVATAAAS